VFIIIKLGLKYMVLNS